LLKILLKAGCEDAPAFWILTILLGVVIIRRDRATGRDDWSQGLRASK